MRANSALRTLSRSFRQYAIYTLYLRVWLPNPDDLHKQPMPGFLHTTFHRDREWTRHQCDNGRLVLLQYSELFSCKHSAVRVLLWIDGSAEIPGQLYAPSRIFTSIKNSLLIRRISSPPSPRHCLSRPTLFYQPLSCRSFIHLQLNHDSTSYNLFGRHVRITTSSWHVVGPCHCPSHCLRLPPPRLDVRLLLLLRAPTTS